MDTQPNQPNQEASEPASSTSAPIAHIVENINAPAVVAESRKRTGRPTSFTEQDDLIVVREVAAKRAHTAQHGQKQELWSQVAMSCNCNRSMSRKVSWKSARDRFEKLLEDYVKKERKDSLTSGVAGPTQTEIE